jgi:hypothetical protein
MLDSPPLLQRHRKSDFTAWHRRLFAAHADPRGGEAGAGRGGGGARSCVEEVLGAMANLQRSLEGGEGAEARKPKILVH